VHLIHPSTGLVSPGDLLYVGRYLTVGSTQGNTPDPSSLLTLRVLTTSPHHVTPASPDVVCEALSDARLGGLVTIWHPGGQQQQRQQVDDVAEVVEQQHEMEEGHWGGGGGSGAAAAAAAAAGTEDAFGCMAAAPAPLQGAAGGQVAVGRAADGSANYSLPILSDNDLAALKVRSYLHWLVGDGGLEWGGAAVGL